VTDPVVKPNETLSATSTSLLLRAKAQDPQAWQRLVDLYLPFVYRWCRGRGLQEADAADVGQEVFRKVHRHIAGFRHDRPGDTFRGWLREITENTLRDFFKKRTTGPIVMAGLDSIGAPESADDAQAETAELVRRALQLIEREFEERTREAFFRLVLNDELPADVAQALGIKASAVYQAKSRVLRRLKEEFAYLIEFQDLTGGGGLRLQS
jgi:RNA polymerase sigma-70 factor (ECF subfamily)